MGAQQSSNKFPKVRGLNKTHSHPPKDEPVLEREIEILDTKNFRNPAPVYIWDAKNKGLPRIYLAADVGADMIKYAGLWASEENPRETIGVLYGEAGRWEGTLTIFITAALWIASARATLAEVEISPELFGKIFDQEDLLWPRRRRVGWFHSHPGWGLQFSARDRENQAINFDMPWQLGLLLETHEKSAAYYVWDNEQPRNLVRSDPFLYHEVMCCLSDAEQDNHKIGYTLSSSEDRSALSRRLRQPPESSIENRDFKIQTLGRARGEREACEFIDITVNDNAHILMDRSLANALKDYLEGHERRDLVVYGYLGGEQFTYTPNTVPRPCYLIHSAVVGFDSSRKSRPHRDLVEAIDRRWCKEMGNMQRLGCIIQEANGTAYGNPNTPIIKDKNCLFRVNLSRSANTTQWNLSFYYNANDSGEPDAECAITTAAPTPQPEKTPGGPARIVIRAKPKGQ